MLILIHGDNVEGSRAELNSLKQEASGKDWEIRQLDGKGLSEDSLIYNLQSHSILGNSDTLLVVENLLTSLGKKDKAKDKRMKTIMSAQESENIILWEAKEIETSIIKLLGGKLQEKLFKLPVFVFQLLDGLGLNPLKTNVEILEKILATTPGEVIFTLLVRRVRDLVMAKDNVFSEGKQAWQKERLTKQAGSFTLEKLLTMEKVLLDMEYQLKTGVTPFSLRQLIEQFLIK